MKLLEFIESNELRSAIETIMLIGGCIFLWLCMYKYTECKEKNNKRIEPISNNYII